MNWIILSWWLKALTWSPVFWTNLTWNTPENLQQPSFNRTWATFKLSHWRRCQREWSQRCLPRSQDSTNSRSSQPWKRWNIFPFLLTSILNKVHDTNSPQKRLAGLKTARALHLLLKTGGGTLQVPLRRNTRLQGEKKCGKKNNLCQNFTFDGNQTD